MSQSKLNFRPQKTLDAGKPATRLPSRNFVEKNATELQLLDSNVTNLDVSEQERVLRAFDLTLAYGPCMGLTRMERWERAARFGLDPPPEVRDMLQRLGPGSAANKSLWEGRI